MDPSPPIDPAITRGSILIYRVYDIAEEIDLVQADRILSQEQNRVRLKIARGSQSIVVRNAPLRVGLGEIDLRIGTLATRADVTATLWDYGCLSVVFQVQIPPGTPWSELIKQAGAVLGEGGSDDEINAIARRKSQELSKILGPALKRPSEWDQFEDYVIYFFQEISGIAKPMDLVRRADVPGLILGEAKEKLGDKSREGILQYVFQYAETDLAVVDWNSAIVLEPSGQRDLTDVLEFALTHLLELRYYDDVLDDRLADLYDTIEKQRHGILRNYFSDISKEANTRFLEFSEFVERLDNSLKVVGDFYLAVIFRAAVRRFRLSDWQESVTRKINLMGRVSQLLQGEFNVQRGHWLEIIIIALIAFEIVSAIFKP